MIFAGISLVLGFRRSFGTDPLDVARLTGFSSSPSRPPKAIPPYFRSPSFEIHAWQIFDPTDRNDQAPSPSYIHPCRLPAQARSSRSEPNEQGHQPCPHQDAPLQIRGHSPASQPCLRPLPHRRRRSHRPATPSRDHEPKGTWDLSPDLRNLLHA